ncbi:MAG: hypothetical protein V3R25_07285 [Nitrosomonadaceae bacterium]
MVEHLEDGSWHAAAPHDLLDILLLKSFVESPTDSLPAIQIPQDDYCFEIIIQVLQVLPMHALLEMFEALQANLCFKKKHESFSGKSNAQNSLLPTINTLIGQTLHTICDVIDSELRNYNIYIARNNFFHTNS